MPIIHLKTLPEGGIEITAEPESGNAVIREFFHLRIKPGESFGGYSYDELLAIATTSGKMNADDLRV